MTETPEPFADIPPPTEADAPPPGDINPRIQIPHDWIKVYTASDSQEGLIIILDLVGIPHQLHPRTALRIGQDLELAAGHFEGPNGELPPLP